ncbi:AraC-like DNA-binding protein [Streptosporangium lutulentum]|uniref:AraC-like DNA-binding protein n=1 Tax=Streptosporangium lutulentum TaxID=1461250 RepID=A0ABT9Q400_9ACTN|nr:AraC-like DNA-binding protein [Streptosporangium lutulentum]
MAHAWGFSDAGHFSRGFHHAYGVLPGAWQRTARRSRP